MDHRSAFALRAAASARRVSPRAASAVALRCARALPWCLAVCLVAPPAGATLTEKARESGCVNKPVVVEGTTYKCYTASGAFSYFNVPDGAPRAPEPASRRVPSQPSSSVAPPPAPSGFPRIDAATQRGRDDVRRKILGDELAAEERLLADARTAFGFGAFLFLFVEQANADKYRQRIARLREAVELHERNIDALRKELGNTK